MEGSGTILPQHRLYRSKLAGVAWFLAVYTIAQGWPGEQRPGPIRFDEGSRRDRSGVWGPSADSSDRRLPGFIRDATGIDRGKEVRPEGEKVGGGKDKTYEAVGSLVPGNQEAFPSPAEDVLARYGEAGTGPGECDGAGQDGSHPDEADCGRGDSPPGCPPDRPGGEDQPMSGFLRDALNAQKVLMARDTGSSTRTQAHAVPAAPMSGYPTHVDGPPTAHVSGIPAGYVGPPHGAHGAHPPPEGVPPHQDLQAMRGLGGDGPTATTGPGEPPAFGPCAGHIPAETFGPPPGLHRPETACEDMESGQNALIDPTFRPLLQAWDKEGDHRRLPLGPRESLSKIGSRFRSPTLEAPRWETSWSNDEKRISVGLSTHSGWDQRPRVLSPQAHRISPT